MHRFENATVGAAGVLIGALVIYLASALPPSRTADVGPGALPLIIGIGLVAISIVLMLQKQVTSRAEPDGETIGDQTKRALAALATVAVYCVAVEFVGFFVPTLLFAAAIIVWMDGRVALPRAIVTSLVLCGSTYLLFKVLLDLPLP